MYVIGVDPHKGSHTVAVLDAEEELLGELRVDHVDEKDVRWRRSGSGTFISS